MNKASQPHDAYDGCWLIDLITLIPLTVKPTWSNKRRERTCSSCRCVPGVRWAVGRAEQPKQGGPSHHGLMWVCVKIWGKPWKTWGFPLVNPHFPMFDTSNSEAHDKPQTAMWFLRQRPKLCDVP